MSFLTLTLFGRDVSFFQFSFLKTVGHQGLMGIGVHRFPAKIWKFKLDSYVLPEGDLSVGYFTS